MAGSDILSAIQTLQAHLENQIAATNDTLTKFMSAVESRFTDLTLPPPVPPPPLPPRDPLPFRSMKMDVPSFDGSDPSGWIFRVEEFFDFHQTPEEQRLRIVSFHMEGPAAPWFQWMKANRLLSTWPVFLHSVRHRFGASIYDDPQGRLSKLTQTSTVADFQAAFEAIMNQVVGISESLLVSFFVTGLKADIRRELSFSKPATLMEAFALARAYEARLEESRSEHRWPSHPPVKATPVSFVPPSSPSPSSIGSSSVLPPPPPAKPTTTPLLPAPTLPIHRFSPQELREKREKGLCYNCDQKWAPNHRCRSRFYGLLGTDDDTDQGDPSSEENPSPEETPDPAVCGDISTLNTLSGLGRPRSLHLSGAIHRQAV